jgi:hypothetical protein
MFVMAAVVLACCSSGRGKPNRVFKKQMVGSDDFRLY